MSTTHGVQRGHTYVQRMDRTRSLSPRVRRKNRLVPRDKNSLHTNTAGAPQARPRTASQRLLCFPRVAAGSAPPNLRTPGRARRTRAGTAVCLSALCNRAAEARAQRARTSGRNWRHHPSFRVRRGGQACREHAGSADRTRATYPQQKRTSARQRRNGLSYPVTRRAGDHNPSKLCTRPRPR